MSDLNYYGVEPVPAYPAHPGGAGADLNYYGTPPALPHRGGLRGWGITAIIIGSLYALSSGVVLVLVPVLVAWKPGAMDAAAIGSTVAALVLTGGMGAALLMFGAGCCRGRRWSRPVAVAGGWVAVGHGVATLVMLAFGLAAAVANPPPASSTGVPPGFALATAAVGGITTSLVMIGVPAWVVGWFRRPSVGEALAVMDPAPRRWTDGVPVPALAWAIACVWMGVTVAVRAVGGMAFWFTAVPTGPVAVTAGVLLAAGLVVAGVGSYRRSAVAWAAGVAVAVLLSASTLTFAVAGDTAAYRRLVLDRATGFTRAMATPPPAPTPSTTVRRSGTKVTVNTFSVGTSPRTGLPPGSEWAASMNSPVLPGLLYAALAVLGVCVRRSVVVGRLQSGGDTP